jgi:hypothetical protein
VYELIWQRVVEGERPGEIARELGVPPSWVSDRLSEFYEAVLLAHGTFPPVRGDEYAALRDHIAEHGVLEPIIVDENDQTIKGRTRRHIAAEVGIECPKRVVRGLSADEKRELSIALTVGRRQLTRVQKRAVIEAELMANPARSDRKIAAICGTTHPTVAAARRELADEERRYLNPEAEVESGKSFQPAGDKILGRASCPCCSEELVIACRGGELMLEQPFLTDA